ncbi:MAG: hypothetical protein ACI4V7_12215 [Succinivibrionaceae bacterium]
MEMPSFLKLDGQSFLFKNDGIFRFYVPEKYFTTKLAEFLGEYVSIFGILNYAIFDKNDKPIGGLKNFKFPTTFLTKPDDIEILKGIKLTKNMDPQDYRVLKYYKEGVIVVRNEVVEDAANLDKFYAALQSGNLPNTIPYNEWQDYFLENIKLTGNGYNVSAQLIGVIFSELCRSSKDSSIPFRLSKSNDMTDYRTCSIKEIPRGISPFTALTSECWDDALMSSITVGETGNHSPMEKIMMD